MTKFSTPLTSNATYTAWSKSLLSHIKYGLVWLQKCVRVDCCPGRNLQTFGFGLVKCPYPLDLADATTSQIGSSFNGMAGTAKYNDTIICSYVGLATCVLSG